MKKKHVTWALSALILLTLVILPTIVLAQGANPINEGLEKFSAENVALGTKDIRTSVGQIINVLMGFLGVIAVVIVLIGGFKWMTAGGNEEKVGEAKKLIMSGVIGLAIVLASYSIATFVVLGLINATS